MYIEEGDDTQGIGLFGRFGIAVDQRAPLKRFTVLGFGATPDQDTFGIGFYFIQVSH